MTMKTTLCEAAEAVLELEDRRCLDWFRDRSNGLKPLFKKGTASTSDSAELEEMKESLLDRNSGKGKYKICLVPF